MPQFPLIRRDSSSSDEDGLREVLPEELEDLELGNVGHNEPQVPLDLPADGAAANEVNPHFNANWEPEHSGIAKKLGMYVPANAFVSVTPSLLLWCFREVTASSSPSVLCSKDNLCPIYRTLPC